MEPSIIQAVDGEDHDGVHDIVNVDDIMHMGEDSDSDPRRKER